MTERISILGLPGLIESTTLARYYEIFGSSEITLYGDLEEIVSWATLDHLYDLLESLNNVTFEEPRLEVEPLGPHELNPLARLVEAVTMSPDRFSWIWLKSFIINIIQCSKETDDEGLHFLLMSDDLGAVLVKTSERKTIYEAHRSRLARLRWKFSKTM